MKKKESSRYSQLRNSGLCGQIEFLQKNVVMHTHKRSTHTQMIERENITDHNGNHMVQRRGGVREDEMYVQLQQTRRV